MPEMIRIYEQTLTDGSKVYGVEIGGIELHCESEAKADELANAIDRLSINAQFDGWGRVHRAA